MRFFLRKISLLCTFHGHDGTLGKTSFSLMKKIKTKEKKCSNFALIKGYQNSNTHVHKLWAKIDIFSSRKTMDWRRIFSDLLFFVNVNESTIADNNCDS